MHVTNYTTSNCKHTKRSKYEKLNTKYEKLNTKSALKYEKLNTINESCIAQLVFSFNFVYILKRGHEY